MYQLVIFDMDGTILDSLEDLKNSVNFALGSQNMPMRNTDEIRSFVGNGVRTADRKGGSLSPPSRGGVRRRPGFTPPGAVRRGTLGILDA